MLRAVRLGALTASVLLGAGCAGNGPTGTGGDGGSPGNDAAMQATGCPTQAEIAFDTNVSGNTSSGGWNQSLTSWFAQSDVACAPATQSASYPAPFQVYSLMMPAQSDWDVVVTPAAGVDVNVVAWQQSPTDSSCYPTRGIGVVTCEAHNAGAAGVEESVRLNTATRPYRVVVLVSTPTGGTAGAFTLRVRNH